MKIQTNLNLGNGDMRDKGKFYGYKPRYICFVTGKAISQEENITFEEALFRANEQRKLIEMNDKKVRR